MQYLSDFTYVPRETPKTQNNNNNSNNNNVDMENLLVLKVLQSLNDNSVTFNAYNKFYMAHFQILMSPWIPSIAVI